MSPWIIYLLVFIVGIFVGFIVILQAINYSDVSSDLKRVKFLLEDIKIRMVEMEEDKESNYE